MKKLYFKFIRWALRTINPILSHIYSPWSRKSTNFQHVIDIQKIIKIGDAIVTRTDGEITAIVIPGYWKHLAIYIGDGKIIEASTSGVRIRYLADLIMRVDSFAIMRNPVLRDYQRNTMKEFLLKQEGKPYDFQLLGNDREEFYCSELYLEGTNQVINEYFNYRERAGVMTFTPNDCYEAKSKTELLMQFRKEEHE